MVFIAHIAKSAPKNLKFSKHWMRVWLCIAGGKVSRPKYFMGYFSLEDKAYKKFLFYVYHYVGSFCVDSLRQGISTDDQFKGMLNL